jgi:hypothetical protein
VRTLPLRLAQIDGESLPGYVARYSHTFQFPPGDVLRALGLDGGSGIVLSAGRYGAWLPPDRLERVASATGIDPARVERMLLSRFAGRAFEQPAGPLDAALAAAAQGHEVLIRCSRFCPHCMRENGAWLRARDLAAPDRPFPTDHDATLQHDRREEPKHARTRTQRALPMRLRPQSQALLRRAARTRPGAA